MVFPTIPPRVKYQLTMSTEFVEAQRTVTELAG
jgi:DNA-binding HxlR family transcriptional regulator